MDEIEAVFADNQGNPLGAGAQRIRVMAFAVHPSAWGSLNVDGSSRTVVCTYCNSFNYLPDGMWLRMHPAPRREWFRLVIDIDEASLAAERSRSVLELT